MEERLLFKLANFLKAILQAIFAFGMRCFKLPVGLCKDIAQGDDSYTLVRLIGKL